MFFDKKITKEVFIPIGAGGGIEKVDDVKKLLRSGADKVVVNSLLLKNRNELRKIVKVVGRQSIIGSLDVIKNNHNFYVYDNNKCEATIELASLLKKITSKDIGELYITSIDKDGTGQGYSIDIIDKFKSKIKSPIIISGGAGNWKHLLEGLKHKDINAVSTANLLNFIGSGFKNARIELLKTLDLPKW